MSLMTDSPSLSDFRVLLHNWLNTLDLSQTKASTHNDMREGYEMNEEWT